MTRHSFRALLVILMLAACKAPSKPELQAAKSGPVLIASGAPLSFVVPQGWEMYENGLTTLLRPAGKTFDAPSIAIQPVATAGQPESVVPLLKRSLTALPEVTRYSLLNTHPADIDGAPVIAYRSAFHYFDVPMYRHGYIIPVDHGLVDVAITSPATKAGASDYFIDEFTETIALPKPKGTIGHEGIGANSTL